LARALRRAGRLRRPPDRRVKRLARASGGASSARGACAVAVAEHRVAAPVVLDAVVTYFLG
jgi:hypothetical protein